MPYRFVIFGVDRVLVAWIIISIKFCYKSWFDIIIFTPLYLRTKTYFRKCIRKNVNGSIQDKNKIIQDLSPNYQRNQQIINNDMSPSMTLVCEKDDDEVAKLTRDQSQKFFYQQFLDWNDILAALIIVIVLRSFDDNIVSDIDSRTYQLFIIVSGVELFFDIVFTLVAYLLVPKRKSIFRIYKLCYTSN